MTSVVALSLLACCWLYAAAQPITIHEQQQWHQFKSTFGKAYPHPEEESNRRQVFVNNLRTIEEHNKEFQEGKTRFTMKMNKFGDLTSEEFRKLYATLSKQSLSRENKIELAKEDLPGSLDWREKGAITPIKDQGGCGSCWAFSATGAVEGMTYLKTGKLVSLSEQNLIDCSQEYGNHGCGGGNMDKAFDYIIANGGIETEQSYPYEGQETTCLFDASGVGATVKNYTYIKEGSEEDLMAAVAKRGPISVAINGGTMSFQFYEKGVYDSSLCNPENLNHAVLVVGYGADKQGEKYWIVKNSWGTDWGLQGYIWLAKDNNNQCGVASAAIYPIV